MNKETEFVNNLKGKTIITTKQFNWLKDIVNKQTELSAEAERILNNIEKVVDSKFNQQRKVKPVYSNIKKKKVKPKKLRHQFGKNERLGPVPNTTFWNRGK